jgi:Protein of unknown function with PCYCGC motif
MRAQLKSFRPGVAIGLTLMAVAAAGALAACRSAAKPAAAASTSLTMDPAQFDGDTKKAYIVARKHPELLAQLDCYCGCEQHEGHKNLLDCFRTRHGAGCDTCVGEAVTAGKLAESGMPVEQIRAALRDRYAHGG